MQALLWAFSFGSFSSAFWPVLPSLWGLICLIALCLPFVKLPFCDHPFIACLGVELPVHFSFVRRVRPSVLIALFSGMLWATVWGLNALDHELPESLDKTDYRVQGVVVGLPDRDARRIKFQLRVETLETLSGQSEQASSSAVLNVPALKILSLSWYGRETLTPGQKWQLTVRLRHPRGFVNPGGFDYRSWLFRSGISATGYVRKSSDNLKLFGAQSSGAGNGDDGKGIDHFRKRVVDHIQQLPLSASARALLGALTVGDKRRISAESWRQLQSTGTIHLAVISGLHIGLAALVGSMLGFALGRVFLLGGGVLLPRQLGVLLGWVSGLVYASLAGFSLPTLRAFVMLSVFALIFLLKRNASPFTSLLWAWAVVSVLEPLAMLSPGFWLSFTAVGVLVVYFRARPEFSSHHGNSFKQLAVAQWVLLLGLSGWLLLFQGEIPLLTPLVNFVAVPWLGFLVVPLCLFGVGLFTFSEPWADFCWQLAGRQLEWFSQSVAWLSSHESLIWMPSLPDGLLPKLALIFAGFLLMAPRGLKLRGFAVLIFLAVVCVDPDRDEVPLAMTVLDVGQGLAVVVETPEGVLVYDTGPSFSEHFDVGSGIIVPYLRQRGYTELDVVLVSHSDQDHSGGLKGLLRYYQPEVLLLGSPNTPGKAQAVRGSQPCTRGLRWQWGEVGFEILHPAANEISERHKTGRKSPQNNKSCVLMIAYRDQVILLTGDIEKSVEQQLLGSGVLPDKITVLLAPHHGSQSSSSSAFVNRLAPQHVVYSAGYHHHFGHPHPKVVSRYEAVGSQQWNTASAGALSFNWDVDGELELGLERARRRIWHYWQKGGQE